MMDDPGAGARPPEGPDSPGGGTREAERGGPSRPRPDSPRGVVEDPHREGEPDSPGGGETDTEERGHGPTRPDSPGGGEQGR